MAALDVIALPGHPGMYARRVAVEAWQSAGSPPVNSAGRLYAEQKRLWDGWRQRLPGFNPADNPDDESEALAHVRFVAFDIDPTADRIKRLTAAGLRRPYTYEPWHWELPNVHSYALVRSIPTTASLNLTRITEQEDDMKLNALRTGDGSGSIGLINPDGTLDGLNIDEYNALLRAGLIDAYHQESDGTVWNTLTARTVRVRASAHGDPAALAASVAALLVPAVVSALGANGGITQANIEAATEAAVRAVFADAATK